ncbi:hypothetical protein BDV28DRAFT_136834 [Aspergillus coremiiformis]|uniref:Uncharacterized protein n=1 Tax=Aspergillus coremiiformis TaxID=138285 RepID=A0A5N6Z1K4_9EURO|nr:hypothetical protein BDV28DRAFT_136834 [Aspergillus coremiiformis]
MGSRSNQLPFPSSSSNSSCNRVNFGGSPQHAHEPRESSAVMRSSGPFIHGQRLSDDRAGHQEYRISPGSTISHQHTIGVPESTDVPRHQINLQPIPEQASFVDGTQSNIRSEQGTWDNVQAQRDIRNSSHRLRSFTSILGRKSMRRQLITLITSAIFLILVIALYFAFTVSKSNIRQELHILLIFMILILAIVFCHSLIRFFMAISRSSGSAVTMNRIPSRAGPTGYAQPERPIPVVLAGDEENLADTNSPSREKVAPPPPAYGLWRSSVRINPDLLYWHRVVDNASPLPQQANRAQGSGSKAPGQRPPSYTSDNGIDYVIEAQPRSRTQDRFAEPPGRR